MGLGVNELGRGHLRIPRSWARGIGLVIAFVLLATLTHGLHSAQLDRADSPSFVSATTLGQGDGCDDNGPTHDHALCGYSTCCPGCASVDAAGGPIQHSRTAAVAISDSLESNSESVPLFHPPKLLIFA